MGIIQFHQVCKNVWLFIIYLFFQTQWLRNQESIINCKEVSPNQLLLLNLILDYESFKRQLKDVNLQFERAREWADLSQCLQRVKKTIDNFAKLPIPLKKDLAKRLAQCLNPDLNVIHQLTLEVYQLVFARELELMDKLSEEKKTFGADLALFYSGLFNFYQFAAFEVKRQFMEMIQKQVLMFKRELILSLPGFMCCILPALEEQNGDLLKKIEEVLAKTEEIVGTSKFYGEIWKTMVRTPRCRLPAIKYLDRKIPRDIETAQKKVVYLSIYNQVVRDGKVLLEEYQKDELSPQWRKEEENMEKELRKVDQKQLQSYFFFYYPNKDQMVINALLAGLVPGDQKAHINRATLDFLISHMSIKGQHLSVEEKIDIVEGCLTTLLIKDFAFMKKFFLWFQGHLEEEDQLEIDDPAVQTIVPAIKRVLQRYLNWQEEEMETTNHDQKQLTQLVTQPSLPIVMIINFLGENSAMPEKFIEDISADLIRYIRHYKIEKGIQNKQKNEHFIQRCNDLFNLKEINVKSVWNSLSSKLKDEIDKIQDENDSDCFHIEAIDLITFFLQSQQQKMDQDLEKKQMKSLTRSHKVLVQDPKEQHDKRLQFVDSILPIFSILLSGVNKISRQMKHLEATLPALDLIEDMIKIFIDLRRYTEKKVLGRKQEVQEAVQSFNKFYIELMENIYTQKNYDIRQSNQSLMTLKKSSSILYKIQSFVDQISFDKMPEWLKKVIECSTKKDRGIKVILISIDVFLKIIEKDDEREPQIKKLKELVLPKNDQPQNCCIEIIKTLWSLLDEPSDQFQIVQLLKKFDTKFPRIFTDVVTDGLNSKEREVKHRAVTKFSIFWKLTEQDYPKYKPFELMQIKNPDQQVMKQNSENSQTQKIIREEIETTRSYVALHKMLQILDDDDPTLRLSCRSWLSESKTSFLRILDPILNDFMGNKVYRSFTGQNFFLPNYDPKFVTENFTKLRNIILNTQSEFIEYIVTTQLSEFITKETNFQEQFGRQIENVKKKIELRYCNERYIIAIVLITLQFITGQVCETLSSTLYQETQTVNASACEFMELIMKSINPFKEFSFEITHLIINPLVRSLKEAITARNNAQQVHLLNLLRVIVIEGNFFYDLKTISRDQEDWNKKINENAKQLFASYRLIDCMVQGMNSKQSFVRYHYIKFTEKIVPFITKSIEPAIQCRIIKDLIKTFCILLQRADVSQYSLHFDKAKRSFQDLIPNNGISSHNQKLSNLFQPNAQMTALYGKGLNSNGNDLVLNQENDISQIIDGLKNILNHCLQIKLQFENKEDQSQAEALMAQYKEKEEVIQQTSFFGFFSTATKNTLKNSKSSISLQQVFNDEIKNILIGVINCWNSVDFFNTRDLLFTRLGILPYCNEDKGKMINKILKQKIELIKNGFFEANASRQPFNEVDIKTRRPSKILRDRENQMLKETLGKVENNSELPITHREYLLANFNQVQLSIVNFLQPMTEDYCKEIIKGLIDIWLTSDYFTKIGMSVNEGCVKIIQLLLSLSIEPHIVIDCLNSYILNEEFNSRKDKRENQLDNTNKNRATMQSLICHFVYTYLLHSIGDLFDGDFNDLESVGFTDVQSQELNCQKLYTNMKKFIDNFIYTRHPVTISWLLEILYILSAKFKPEDSKIEKKVKLQFHELLETLLRSATQIIQDTFGVKYHETYKLNELAFSPTFYELMKRFEFTMSKHPQIFTEHLDKNQLSKTQVRVQNQNLAFSQRQLTHYQEIPLQKESMFQKMQIVRNPRAIQEPSYISDFLKNLNQIAHDDSQKVDDTIQREIFKVMTIVTLRQILVPLTESIHSADNKEGAYISMSIVVNGVTKVIESHIKSSDQDGVKETKKGSVTKIIAELSTELLSHLALTNNLLQKNYKQEITVMFNEEKFFFLNARILRHWQQIMGHFLKENDEVFEEQLMKYNRVEGFFTTKKAENMHKSLTFKRLAFLVYSSKTDSFEENALDGLLKKMTEGFKNQDKNEEMKQQLFLLSRILMLRLTSTKLEDALRKLWPHLLNELVQVFDPPNGKRDMALIFEAIKIIELMSQLNIEDFQIDQWMFLFDGYGLISGESKDLSQKMQSFEEEKILGDINGILGNRNCDTFQPYMIQFMCKNPDIPNQQNLDQSSEFNNKQIFFYKIKDKIKGQDKNTKVTPNSIEKRQTAKCNKYGANPSQINLDPNSKLKIEYELNAQSVFEYVKEIQDLLADSNLKRTEIDRVGAEALIEKDFLKKPRNF